MFPQTFGKLLILAGVVLVAAGVLVSLFGKIPFLGRLPGDILIHRGNTTIFLPITSCVLLSILATIVLRIFRS